MKRILVTGGLGYIGSHTVVELQTKGFDVIIIDNLSNSKIEVLDNIASITGNKPDFFQIDLKNKTEVQQFFKSNTIDGVIHFAAYKAVGESVKNPIKYYENNIGGLINLLNEVQNHKIHSFLFSSSCTVYGEVNILPITENTPFKTALSPYGSTKQIGETILKDLCKLNQLNAISLRYFNPIGAHKSIKIGELPLGIPQNLIPYITQTAAGIRKKLSVFGNDFNTPDGTAIRDYIHVVDLAKAHIIALERLLKKENKTPYEAFNIGTGKGCSVLEIISAFEKVTGKKLPYTITNRREGDVTATYSDTSLANKELQWTAKESIETALFSAWEWQKKQ